MTAPAQHTPRTMSRASELMARNLIDKGEGGALEAARLLVELDAERASHAETLAALEKIVAMTGADADGVHDEWSEAVAFDEAQDIARAAIARAKGGRS